MLAVVVLCVLLIRVSVCVLSVLCASFICIVNVLCCASVFVTCLRLLTLSYLHFHFARRETGVLYHIVVQNEVSETGNEGMVKGKCNSLNVC